jgi:hypothetical protein
MENTNQVIESLLEIGIWIVSVVGNRLSTQRQGLSPSSETSIQKLNIERCPPVRAILYV